MSRSDYFKGMRYEMFIRNAFDCPSGMRNGAHHSFMQNVLTMERGETYAKHLGTFEKQFDKIKIYTSKALLKFERKKPYSREGSFFKELDLKLNSVNSTEELMSIIDLAANKVNEIRNA